MKTFKYTINYSDGTKFTARCPDYLYPELLVHQTIGLDRTSTKRNIDSINFYMNNKEFTVNSIDAIINNGHPAISKEEQEEYKNGLV